MSHASVELWPPLINSWLALKVVMIGALDFVTVSVASAVGLPALLEAVRVYVVVKDGATLCVPVEDTVPISGLMETDAAPVTLHDNTADCPVNMLSVLKPNFSIDGGAAVTVIVTDLRTEPDILLAIRVYVAVVSGDTVLLPLDETVPIPGLIETELAPATSQCKVASWPGVIVDALASKDDTTGATKGLEISPHMAMAAPANAATMTTLMDIFIIVPL